MFSALFDSFLRGVTRFPKVTLLCVFAVTLVAAAGLPNFKLDASSESLTLEHDTSLDNYRNMVKNYNSGDFLVVTFNPHKDLFSNESIATLVKLRDDLKNIEGIVAVNSILDVPLLYSPKLPLADIVSAPRTLQTPGVEYAQAKNEFLTSPVYKDLILGPDGQTTALQAYLQVDSTYIKLIQQRDGLREKQSREGLSVEESTELAKVTQTFLEYRTKAEQRNHARVAEIREVTQRYRGDAEIFVGGLTMITADMVTFIKSDLVIFGSAVLLFMIAVLSIIFRKVRFVVIPMLTCMAAVLIMLGYVSWVDWRLTVISSNFVALLLIISLAIIIHLVVRYREYEREYPLWTQQALVIATAKYMALPCLYTVLTSMVAFISLVVSDIRPVIDFGWLMTVGLALALVLAFVLLPASLMLLKREKHDTTKNAQSDDVPITAYLANVVDGNGKAILFVAAVIAGLSVWGLTRLQVENRFIDYFHSSTEIYQGLSVIDKNLGGTTSLDLVISVDKNDQALMLDNLDLDYSDEDDPFEEAEAFDETDPFAEPNPLAEEDPFAEADPFSEHGQTPTAQPSYWMTVAGLRKIEALHDYLEVQPEIGKVQSLAILYKVGRDINGSLNDFELEVMQKSLPKEVKSALIAPYLNDRLNQTRVTLRIHDSYPGLKRSELVERIKNHIRETENLNIRHVEFTGLLVLYNNMLASLFSSQITTLGLVFLGIMIMFVVLFRSFLVAVVAIIPNILAAISILGFMGIFGLPLDMMTITVAAITVGIGVDNTIHYVHRFRDEVVVDGDYLASMHRAHRSIGRAMYYTSVIIIFGFSIMVLSEFIPTIYFGLLTGLAMFVALMGALLLLPQLILVVKPFSKNLKVAGL